METLEEFFENRALFSTKKLNQRAPIFFSEKNL